MTANRYIALYLRTSLASLLLISLTAATACSREPDNVSGRADLAATTTIAATPRVQIVTARTFDEKVLKSSGPVLVDFYADWCGPCQIQRKILDSFVKQLDGATIVKVNVDKDPQLARQYGVTGLPTLLIFQGGKAVQKQVGLAGENQLQTIFANYLVEDQRQRNVAAR